MPVKRLSYQEGEKRGLVARTRHLGKSDLTQKPFSLSQGDFPSIYSRQQRGSGVLHPWRWLHGLDVVAGGAAAQRQVRWELARCCFALCCFDATIQ